MADDYKSYFNENMGALKQLLAQQEQIAGSSKPTGMFANVDPVMLGLASGLLAPTKTGGFGESLSSGLAGAQAPLEAMRKRQMDAQEKILQTRLAAARLATDMARAERYGAGTPSERSDLLAARDYDQAAMQAASEGDDVTAASYRATAKALRDRHAVKTSVGATAPASAASTDATKDTESHWYDPSTWESFKGKPTEPTITGALIGEKPSKAKTINEALAEGAKGAAQSEVPEEAPTEAQPSAPKPPKAYPDARLGTNPKTGKQGWFVVRDGKYYEVQ